MNPRDAAAHLRRVADYIDSNQHPSRGRVASELRKVVGAMAYEYFEDKYDMWVDKFKNVRGPAPKFETFDQEADMRQKVLVDTLGLLGKLVDKAASDVRNGDRLYPHIRGIANTLGAAVMESARVDAYRSADEVEYPF